MSDPKVVKLTPQLLRQIVNEEVKKSFGDMEDVEKRAKKTKETDADELADSLEHPVDAAKAYGVKEAKEMLRALKLEHTRLVKRTVAVCEQYSRIAKRLKAKKA